LRKNRQGRKESVDVLVADRSSIDSHLLARALQRSRHLFKVVGVATTKSDALRAIRKTKPDIALVSGGFEDDPMGGLELVAQLRDERLATRTIVFLDSPQTDLAIDAFRSGAKGIFWRSKPFASLCKAIRSVHAGQIWASTSDLEIILQSLSRNPVPHYENLRAGLTKREEEVVRKVCEGLSNREISKSLKLSEHTVKNYLSKIFEKLNVSSRSELILYTLSGQLQSGLPQD